MSRSRIQVPRGHYNSMDTGPMHVTLPISYWKLKIEPLPMQTAYFFPLYFPHRKDTCHREIILPSKWGMCKVDRIYTHLRDHADENHATKNSQTVHACLKHFTSN